MSKLNEEYWKYRNLNQDYLTIVEQVKRNREDARKIANERKSLDNTVWESEARLNEAYEVEDSLRREVAVEGAKEDQAKAEAAIRRKNEQYDAVKKDLEELKKEISRLLNRIKNDKSISHMIDVALLMRLKKELVVKTKHWAYTVDFRNKLGMILDNLSGLGSVSEEDMAIRKEYDTTMKSIASLTDMIEYFEEQEARLRRDVIQEEPEGDDSDAPPKERPKTEEEIAADTLRADEILEHELRPRRRERVKAREKLGEIISTQARSVDLDPRDMDGINSVEEMNSKREELAVEIAALEKETAEFAQHIRLMERRALLSGKGGVFSYAASIFMKKSDPLAVEEDENKLKEPDDTQEERFVYRYRVTQRELNRRYNELLGIKDTLTEDAYGGEDEEDI